MKRGKNDILLQPGETIVRKDAISVLHNGVATRVGECYLTNRRIVVASAPSAVGIATPLSALGSLLFGKLKARLTQEEQFPLHELHEIALSKYGLNKTIDLYSADGHTARMVMGPKQRQQWLEALDRVLQAEGLRRVQADAPEHWWIRPEA